MTFPRHCPRISIYTLPFFLFFFGRVASTQAAQGFAVHLKLDFSSAEKAVELYEGLSGSGRDVALVRGSRLALETTALLAGRPLTSSDLELAMDAAKHNQLGTDDNFRIREARGNVLHIKDLLREIRRRNFGSRVVATVEQLFPADAIVTTSIPVYFVAFGHRNIDAYVRRVVWRGDVPQFVGEGEGELTIIVNLAKTVSYGGTVEQRFVGTLGVVAHEVFHAAFGVYKDNSSLWREYYASHQSYLDHLLDLTQNEGIAHYLTFEQQTGGNLPPGWDARVRASFAEFNARTAELCADSIHPARASEIIRSSNTSSYWQSFGAITGLAIARQIDIVLGRRALVETVSAGVTSFFRTYVDLTRQDSNLPKLSDTLLAVLGMKE